MAEIASLIKIPGRQADASDDDLLKLYWNRATVKRELSALRREKYELLDKLKEQEGAIIRSREALDSLERLLANPLAAANAIVYFQLRHLWRVCGVRVEQFSKELRSQRERKERAKLHETALEKRKRRLDILNDKLQGLLIKERNLAHEVETLQQRLDEMNGVMRLVKGQGLKHRVAGLHKGREALQVRVGEIKETQASINGEPLPEIGNLSLESRRLINLAVLALAQELVLHFAEHDLAQKAKASTERTVGDMKFGDRRDCDRLVDRIRGRLSEIKDQKQIADAVKVRTDYLLTQVSYRDDSAAVPLADAFAGIPPQVPGADGGGPLKRTGEAALRVNVLTDDYWNVLDYLI
jgi:predicted  nucleic acid-binding Zn-ribbon protein